MRLPRLPPLLRLRRHGRRSRATGPAGCSFRRDIGFSAALCAVPVGPGGKSPEANALLQFELSGKRGNY